MIVKGFEVEGIIKVDNVRVYGIEESIIASGYPMQTKTVPMADNAPVTNLVISDKDMKRAKHLGNAIPGSGHDCFAKGITVQFDLQVPEYIWRQLDRYHFIDYVSSQSKMHRILKIDLDKACNKYVSDYTKDYLKKLVWMYNNFELVYQKVTDKYVLCYQSEDNEENESIFTIEEVERYDIEFSVDYKTKDVYIEMYSLESSNIIFNKENLFNIIIANTPSGIMLTARMTTNYLQLKSIVNQRSNHKMQEWRLLCDYFKTLPMFDVVCK